ncbi:MAG: hypothetical protein WC858_00755 [Parcubacteria group bacterium]|jgi:hypothetical protein
MIKHQRRLLDELENIYTPINQISQELRERRKNKKLLINVKKNLGYIPACFLGSPKLVLNRCIAGYDNEAIKFLQTADMMGLEPLHIVYSKDKLYTVNKDNSSRCKLIIPDLRKESKTNFKKIIIANSKRYEKHSLKKINTIWGENLVNFHHNLLRYYSRKSVIYDASRSRWLKLNDTNVRHYYEYFLNFFMYHGVLFEVFLLDKGEREFTLNVVLPTFKKAKKKYGMKPLIIKAFSERESLDDYWWSYPKNIIKHLPNKSTQNDMPIRNT